MIRQRRIDLKLNIPKLEWIKKKWENKLYNQKLMYAQIEKNRSSNHCLICISKKSNKTELKKHIYNMHFWMLGKHAH